jgi:hypothetical protein
LVGAMVRRDSEQGQGRCLAVHQRLAGGEDNRLEDGALAVSDCPLTKSAPIPRAVVAQVRLCSGREVWVGKPSCLTLAVKFTMPDDFYCIYDNHLNTILNQ